MPKATKKTVAGKMPQKSGKAKPAGKMPQKSGITLSADTKPPAFPRAGMVDIPLRLPHETIAHFREVGRLMHAPLEVVLGVIVTSEFLKMAPARKARASK